MGIQVLYPGAFTTIQDLGRPGYQAFGVPVSGAMDLSACKAANSLAGNEPGAAVLEMTLLGGTYTFDAPAKIALCGADMSPRIGDVPLPMWKAADVSPGDILSLGYAKEGCRTYLAASGGIDVPLVMGSRSTNVRCHLGGLEGRSLKAGDYLRICKGPERSAGRPRGNDRESDIRIPRYSCSVTVRALPGPQDDLFTEKGLDTFFSSEYVMEEGSDRMGIRLSGKQVESRSGTDILSDGIAFGSVQITSSGQPIVLMADRQTTGGYAKIATVLSEDLWMLAQMKPGDTVHFSKES